VKDSIFQELIARKIITSQNNRLYFLDTVSMSMYGAKAWAFTYQQIGDKKGRQYLFDLGLLMGSDAAEELKQVLDKKRVYLTKKLMDLQTIIMTSGFGKIAISEKKEGLSVQVLENRPMDYSWEMYRQNALMPELYAGIYTGFIRLFLGRTKCRLKLDAGLHKKMGKVRYESDN
jgi:hypothetical protein